MKKVIALVGIGAILVAAIAIYTWQSNQHSQAPAAQTQEDVITQAKAYKPEGACTSALTPAVHKATGARYTFPSGCIAPGWEHE